MSNLLKKFLLSFLSFLILFGAVLPNFLIARAEETATPSASTWYNPGLLEFYAKVFDKSNNDIFGERYTYAQVTWITYSLLGVIAGFAGSNIDMPTLILQIQQIQAGSQPQGLNILMDPNSKLAQTDPIIYIFKQFYLSPPASGRYWLTQKINTFSIVKNAYAAPTNGFGYSSLQIFLPLWTASRNISYGLIIIILISIAFAVMFRVKISPQLVITVQNSLPKIVSTLILITFSYAIVGFLIDFMYLIFGAFVYGMDKSGAFTVSGLKSVSLFNDFLNTSILDKMMVVVGPSVVVLLILFVFSAVPFIGTVMPFLIGVVIAIIIFFIKSFFMLVETYISLVINIIFAPIIILAEAIPFVKANAMGWFKSVLADLTIFAGVGFLFFTQTILWELFTNSNSGWSPPYLHFRPTFFAIATWIGIWAMIPNVKGIVYTMLEKRPGESGVSKQLEKINNIVTEVVTKKYTKTSNG